MISEELLDLDKKKLDSYIKATFINHAETDFGIFSNPEDTGLYNFFKESVYVLSSGNMILDCKQIIHESLHARDRIYCNWCRSLGYITENLLFLVEGLIEEYKKLPHTFKLYLPLLSTNNILPNLGWYHLLINFYYSLLKILTKNLEIAYETRATLYSKLISSIAIVNYNANLKEKVIEQQKMIEKYEYEKSSLIHKNAIEFGYDIIQKFGFNCLETTLDMSMEYFPLIGKSTNLHTLHKILTNSPSARIFLIKNFPEESISPNFEKNNTKQFEELIRTNLKIFKPKKEIEEKFERVVITSDSISFLSNKEFERLFLGDSYVKRKIENRKKEKNDGYKHKPFFLGTRSLEPFLADEYLSNLVSVTNHFLVVDIYNTDKRFVTANKQHFFGSKNYPHNINNELIIFHFNRGILFQLFEKSNLKYVRCPFRDIIKCKWFDTRYNFQYYDKFTQRVVDTIHNNYCEKYKDSCEFLEFVNIFSDS